MASCLQCNTLLAGSDKFCPQCGLTTHRPFPFFSMLLLKDYLLMIMITLFFINIVTSNVGMLFLFKGSGLIIAVLDIIVVIFYVSVIPFVFITLHHLRKHKNIGRNVMITILITMIFIFAINNDIIGILNNIFDLYVLGFDKNTKELFFHS